MPGMDGVPTRPPASRADLHPGGARKTRRRRPSLSSTIARIASVAIVVFVLLTGGISLQMAAGNDPALGPKKRAVTHARVPTTQSATQTQATQTQAQQTQQTQQTQSSPPPVVSRVS